MNKPLYIVYDADGAHEPPVYGLIEAEDYQSAMLKMHNMYDDHRAR